MPWALRGSRGGQSQTRSPEMPVPVLEPNWEVSTPVFPAFSPMHWSMEMLLRNTGEPGETRSSEKRTITDVPAGDVGMVETGKHREIVPVFLQQLQIARGGVMGSGVSGKEVRGIKAEVGFDSDKTLDGLRIRAKGRLHGVEPGQSEGDPGGLQEAPA